MIKTYGFAFSAVLIILAIQSSFAAEQNNSNLNNLPSCPKNIRVAWDDCFGNYRTTNGGKYLGDFKNNKYEGIGLYLYPNGDLYFGEFKANSRNGDGVYIKENGRKIEGKFEDGMVIELQSVNLPDVIDDYLSVIAVKPIKRGKVKSPRTARSSK